MQNRKASAVSVSKVIKVDVSEESLANATTASRLQPQDDKPGGSLLAKAIKVWHITHNNEPYSSW